MWVARDSEGGRCKGWRMVVKENRQETYPGSPLEGAWHRDAPDQAHAALRRLSSSVAGGLLQGPPRAENDRTYHELETLTEVLMLAGTLDQLNLAALVSTEKVCRRIQLIVEAHSEAGQAPSWRMAKW